MEYVGTAQKYGYNIGLAFQVVDDILDAVGDSAVLGKPVGSDADNNKTTYLDFMTIEEAADYAKTLTERACEDLGCGKEAEILKELAYYLLERKN